MIGILIALISGALMSVQGVFNTQWTKASSIWAASAFVQLTALFVCLGAWLCADRSSFMNVLQVQPKYMLLGGAIGAFITYTVIKSMDQLGPARAAADCDFPASGGIYHRASGMVRRGKTAL